MKADHRDQAHPKWARHIAGLLGGLLHEAFEHGWQPDKALLAWDDLTAKVPRP